MEPSREERQRMIYEWVVRVFGTRNAMSGERAARFVEEAVELVQAVGLSRERVMAIVDVVYSRPKGDVFQEIGGVGLTLLALAAAVNYSAEVAEVAEMCRVFAKSDAHFRARQTEKAGQGIALLPDVPHA
jgi:hypothetical protein